MIEGIDHIEIVVRDIDEAATFFGRLGFTELRRGTHHGGSVEMQLPGSHPVVFEFHLGVPGEPPGINHICFRVTDTEQTVAELRANGVTIPDNAHVAKTTKRVIANFRDPMYMKWQLSDGRRQTPDAV